MTVRIATFNVENLMARFDFSGFNNERYRDRTIAMLNVKNEKQYQQLEQARVVAHADDTRQMTALAIADTMADIICLQEVENMQALEAFEHGYLYKMAGSGYRQKFLIDGNDSRGIDVAVMAKETTRAGEEIEFVRATSHAQLTYQELGLHNAQLEEMGEHKHEKVFRRDCLEIDFKIGGRPITLYVSHFKSMGTHRRNVVGRDFTMPVRQAEAGAIRTIIERRFGKGKTANKRWLVCGDLNDYRARLIVKGDRQSGFKFNHVVEDVSGVDPLLVGDFSHDLVSRRPKDDQWTLYHSRGPEEQHLCQLDYILASPSLARLNKKAVPEIIRAGQPWRTPFPPSQTVERYPRTGWDRPKASDHCPVVVALNMV
jgi:predicted extracellular nuclease